MSVQLLQFKRVTKLLVGFDGGSHASTLSAAHAAGVSTINVASSTGLSANDVVRIGDGEDSEIVVVATVPGGGVTYTTVDPTRKAHLSGEVSQEVVMDQYGPIRSQGFKWTGNRNTVDEFVADARLPFVILKGTGAIRGEMEFAALTLANVALALGATRANVIGTNTLADPGEFRTDGNNVGGITNCCVVVEGLLGDNSTAVRAEFYGVQFDPKGFKMQLALGVLSSVPLKFLAGGAMSLIKTASPFTGTTTYVATNQDTLVGLTDFGYFAASTPSAVTSATIAADATAIVSATDLSALVAGDWVQLDQDNLVEFHQVGSVAGSGPSTITTRTTILRAHAAGVVIKKVTLTQLATITEEGVTFGLDGASGEIYTGLREMAAGLRYGTVTADLSFNVTEYSLTTFALMLGLAVPGGNILNAITGLGNTNVNGWYCKGLMASGKNLWVNTWGVQMDLSGAQAVFTNDVKPPVLPFKGRPTSGIHFIIQA